MLTSLTSEQWAAVAEYRDGLLRRSLTDPFDRPRVEAGVRGCYAAIGKSAPLIVWAPGPLTALAWSAMLSGQLAGQLADQLYGQLADQLGGQLHGQLSGQLAGQLRDQLHGQLSGQLSDQLYGQLSGQLSDQLSDQLRDQLSGQLSGQLAGQLYDQLYGQLSNQLSDQLSDQLRDQLANQLSNQLSGQLSGQLAGQLRGQLANQLHGQLADQLYGQLYGQLRDQLANQLSGQLHGQLSGQLSDQLRDQLRGQLHGQLSGQLSDQLRDQLADQLRGQLSDQLAGVLWSWWWWMGVQHWAHIATIDGIKPPPADMLTKAQAWTDMTTVAMSIPLDGICILVDPHTALHRDRDHRLHSTTGPAWAWPDGTAVHAIDGIRVPEWVITNPTAARIVSDELPNTEQRRVAFTLYGWDRAVIELGLEAIDWSADPHLGTLYRLPVNIAEDRATLLLCRNASPDMDGTWRDYGLLAGPECRTVVEAQASLAGVSVSEWKALEGAS